MKVLQISKHYKPFAGGIEQVAHDISDSLLNKYEQKVICFSEDKNDKVEMIDGVEVYKCGYFKKVASQALSFSYGKTLKKLMIEYQPNIVIFHFPNPFVAHYLLKYRKRNFKLIVWFHADIVNQKTLGKFFVGQTKHLLTRADKIITTSPIYRYSSMSLTNFKHKAIVIPSCINETRLQTTEATNKKTQEIKNKYQNKTIVFAIGRHVKYKGLTYLVEVAKYLDQNYQILIAGKGPLTDELIEQAKGLEAEFVIVLNARSGKTGFPNQIEDDPVLNLVLSQKDDYPFSEERRLWYVALTRTKSYLYILVDKENPSLFVKEIIDECDILNPSDEDKTKIACPYCQTGHLVLKRNMYVCSNSPYCNYMITAKDINNPRCPVCNDFLVIRKGKYGYFWGCHNYPYCDYTKQIKKEDEEN